ncbi:MAG: molybdenum cofactor guanylyltransferase [Syntrophobacter sp.]
MTGAVLAGGKSLRFGKNKALEVVGGMRLVERSVQSLRPFCDHVMIVVNDLSLYLELGVPLVRDIIPHQGPLGGLYTALLFSEYEWVFVKATDMPLIVPQVAELIIGARQGFDVVVPMIGDFFEPLFALYNRRCLPVIARQLETPGERQIIHFYKKVRVKSIREEEWRRLDPEGACFRNINTPADLSEVGWT